MLTIFLKLFLAHIIGDFAIQSKDMVVKRRRHIGYLFLHVAIHAIILVLFFANELGRWWEIIVFITLSHLAIDSLKIFYENKWKYRPFATFTIDQIAHLAVLVAATLYVGQYDFSEFTLWSDTNLLYITVFFLLVFVSPVVMQVFFSKWHTESAFETKKKDTLLNAGLVIGILERIMVVLFIHANFLAGIGFLLGAKSIFRFGDLTNAKNTKFTEYILVGTFLSFALAIIIGFALKWTMTLIGG